MKRDDLIIELARLIDSVRRPHPTRVAIDGVDAAGKTMLADELVSPLEAHGRHIIRASIDDFHHPRAVRYRRGSLSPEGYYKDSFDHDLIKKALLEPLGPEGSLRYQAAAFDFRQDTAQPTIIHQAREDSILLFDGIFLLRPELIGFWDYTIFLEVDFTETLPRAMQRDRDLLGTEEQVIERYLKRYIPGQRIYLGSCHPRAHTNVVVDNNDPGSPRLWLSDHQAGIGE
ncbi:MAG: uridine kinase [Anaerolineae bacterium]|nr:uridine kinase [Anaerolineae bacterium]